MGKMEGVREALEFEEKAKEFKKAKDFKKAADFHLQASKLWARIKNFKNQKWNLANYFFCKASLSFDKPETAKRYYLLSEKFFQGIALIEPAFYAAYKAATSEAKSVNDKNESLRLLVESLDLLMEKYANLSDNELYVEKKILHLFLKFKLYRGLGDYERAEFWIGESFKRAQEAYRKFRKKKFWESAIFKEHQYWNLKAKIQEARKDFLKAAEFYRKSAEVIRKLNESRAIDEEINYYKCIAIANKYNKEAVKENLEKAISLAKKRGDKQQEDYLTALKFDHLSKFESDLERKIHLIKKAHEFYLKAKDERTARSLRFVLFFLLSKKLLRERKYEESLNYMKKAIKHSKYTNFPNLVASREILESEKSFHEAYVYFYRGEFDRAAEKFEEWLTIRKDMEGTRRYQIYKNLATCCRILSKEEPNYEELYLVEELLSTVRKNKISLRLYYVAALVYSYITLFINGLRKKEILEEIKALIVDKMTTESLFDLESRFKVQMAVERREWLLKLPSVFAERFDHCLYILRNSLPDFRHIAYREFLLLLENYLKVVVEFNSKLIWKEDWKSELPKLISQNSKDVERFTFGDLVESAAKLGEMEGCLLSKVSPEIFSIMREEVPLRNKLSHELSLELGGISDEGIEEKMAKIMQELSVAFPLCLEIFSNSRYPIYDAKILWNLIPKRVSVFYDNKEVLSKGIYYALPENFVGDRLNLKTLLRAEVLSKILSGS